MCFKPLVISGSTFSCAGLVGVPRTPTCVFGAFRPVLTSVIYSRVREGRVDGLEARVSALLEGRLRAARTAEEMFRVFAKFNPLFVRPRWGAVSALFLCLLLELAD